MDQMLLKPHQKMLVVWPDYDNHILSSLGWLGGGLPRHSVLLDKVEQSHVLKLSSGRPRDIVVKS